MAEVIWSRAAERSLRDIRNFIARDNPEAADRIVTGILDQADMLGDFPRLGARDYQDYGQSGQTGRDVRSIRYGNYRIGYTIRPDGGVEILSVQHTSRRRRGFPF